MKKIIYLLLFGLFASCVQDDFKDIELKDKDTYLDLPKYPEQTIEFTTTTHIPQRILNSSSYFVGADIKTRSGTIIKDSLWSNGFGITYFGVADESIVLENMQRYIYPGSILQGNTVADAEYRSISASIKPITVSVSFPAKIVKGVIKTPSLSDTRQFVNDIVRQENIGKQSASLSFEIDQFTSYEELKIMFGSNKKTSGIFFNSSSGEENFEHKISKGTGIAVKFVQKYFTLDMDIPHGGLVNGDISGLVQYSPVYVSSIAYGRMGIMTIETNESYSDAYSKINEAFSTLFVNKQSNISESVKSLIKNAIVKVFLIGSNGEAGVMAINGFDAFLKVITEGGEFNSNNFGAPLYSSFSYLTDHSPFKVNFKINVDSPPVYGRIEFRNFRKTQGQDNVILGEHETWDEAWDHEVYLAFYSDMGAKMRTIAPSYINFNIIEERIGLITTQDPVKSPTYSYSNKYVTNELKGVEKFIQSFNFMKRYYSYSDWGRIFDINSFQITHFLGHGRFYKGLPPKDMTDRSYAIGPQTGSNHPYPTGAY
ncbi:thiol-activated cytolysin family protein [Parabacteroides sp. AF14-59]|uniref:thiol-activated cytolysin family protein n=1 Tax=Parabacteroides sp. AF14-59 TaxID=2292240 RepID=UPI000F00EDB0|nr:thiol-activated cytolysin family protein [Parabacteroides sp. AF14-59]RHR91514.1 hemolysin [Parabacteroides sp. AF14-59]